jgi:hypothetical protein
MPVNSKFFLPHLQALLYMDVQQRGMNVLIMFFIMFVLYICA